MQFEKCSVDGVKYEEKNGKLYPLIGEQGKPDFESGPVDLKNCSVCVTTL